MESFIVNSKISMDCEIYFHPSIHTHTHRLKQGRESILLFKDFSVNTNFKVYITSSTN